MDQTIKQLKAQLEQNPEAGIEPVLEAIYANYMNTDPIDQERVDRHYRQVEEYIQDLPFTQQDQIYCAMTSICVDQDRIAFFDGIRTGARLILALIEE